MRSNLAIQLIVLSVLLLGLRGDSGGADTQIAAERVTIRLADNSTISGTIEQVDDAGVRFLTDAGNRVFFRREEISAQDAGIIWKIADKGSTDPGRPSTWLAPEEGVRVTKGDETMEGRVTEEDKLKIRIKRAGSLYEYEKAGVKIERPVWISPFDIDPQEAHARLMREQPPRTQYEHKMLADYLMSKNLKDLAEQHYWQYEVLKRKGPQSRLYEDLQDWRQKVQDAKAKEELFAIGRDLLDEQYEAALEKLEKVGSTRADMAGVSEFGHIKQQLSSLREIAIQQRVINSYLGIMDSLLEVTAANRRLGYAESLAYILARLPKDVLQRVADKFGMDEESVQRVWDSRNGGVLFETSYEGGTWLIESPETGDREKWWAEAGNSARYYTLKSAYVEQAMKVVRAFHKECPVCGGLGKVEARISDVTDRGICRSCRGLGKVRVVIYR
jgi:hypothetical protein